MGDDSKRAEQVHIPVEQESVPFYGRSLVAVRLEEAALAPSCAGSAKGWTSIRTVRCSAFAGRPRYLIVC